MTDIPALQVLQPYRQARHALVFRVRLNGAPSCGERRRFFCRMRRHLAGTGYLMGHSHGICAVIPLEGQWSRLGRHEVMNWLLDQNMDMSVHVFMPHELPALLFGAFDPSLHAQLLAASVSNKDAMAQNDEEELRDERDPKCRGQALLCRVIDGLLLQALYRWQTLRTCMKEDAHV